MVGFLGSVGALMLWVTFGGICLQFRQVWRNRVSPTFPKAQAVFTYSVYISYVLWGMSILPTDWYRVVAFGPGIVFISLLWLQYATPRPAVWRMIVQVVGALVLLLTLVALSYSRRYALHDYELVFAIAASLCSSVYLFVGIPRQIVVLLRHWVAGSSLAFNVIILTSYSVWFAYALASHDSFLAATQGGGVIGQGVVVWLHVRK